jgi:hypothetical protein
MKVWLFDIIASMYIIALFVIVGLLVGMVSLEPQIHSLPYTREGDHSPQFETCSNFEVATPMNSKFN